MASKILYSWNGPTTGRHTAVLEIFRRKTVLMIYDEQGSVVKTECWLGLDLIQVEHAISQCGLNVLEAQVEYLEGK